MSNQAAADFLAMLVRDEALRDKVRGAEKGRTEKAPVLVEVAAGHGYDFSANELHDVLCALHQHKIGELTEQELVDVAGGLIELPDWHPDQG
jgi:predicted ribosomally synthesized peptide with nif11-like leader